jgi:hypothetical protein
MDDLYVVNCLKAPFIIIVSRFSNCVVQLVIYLRYLSLWRVIGHVGVALWRLIKHIKQT